MELKVLEAYPRDIGRGIARIDTHTLNLLKARVDEPAEIKGRDGKTTFVKIHPLYSTDEGKKMIRIDGLVRKNASVEVGQTVIVRKAEAYNAELVAVTTSETTPLLDARYLTNATEGIYLKTGDELSVPYFGGRLAFNVINVKPNYDGEAKAARITQNTRYWIVKGVKPEIAFFFKDKLVQLDEEVDSDKVAILLHLELELKLSLSESGVYERKMVMKKDNVADTVSNVISKFYDIGVMMIKQEGDRLWDRILAQADGTPPHQDTLSVGMQEVLRRLKYRIIEEWVKVEV